MKFVARQTGLTIHTIRIWEKRYGAVKPVRAANNRRLYTEEDVERLRLLHDATRAGHSIGQIARATIPQLQNLLRDAGPVPRALRGKLADQRETAAEEFIARTTEAITSFDAEWIAKLLNLGAVELGSAALLQKFVAPLAEQIGELWRAGELTIAHEHFATEQLAKFLNDFARPYSENPSAPHFVLATPTGQLHELGAVVVAAAARSHGWRTTYLGPSLPIEEVAGAVKNIAPRALGLSIVYPPDDEALRRDLLKLRGLLPKNLALLVGGRSADSYGDLWRKIKAQPVADLAALFPALDKLQGRRHRAAGSRAK